MKAKYIFRFQNSGEDYLRSKTLKSQTMVGAFYEARAIMDRAGRTLDSLVKIRIEKRSKR